MDRDDKRRLFDFFAAESKNLKGYVLGKLRSINAMDAEDIVSEVMLKLFTKANSSNPTENLAGYVYRSLNNKIIDYQRERSRTLSLQSFLDEDGENQLMELISDGTSSISSQAERNEFMKRLSRAISSLEPKQRAVFIATEMDDMSFRELSERWQEPIGTLLSRKSRAVKSLRKMLKDYTPEYIKEKNNE